MWDTGQFDLVPASMPLGHKAVIINPLTVPPPSSSPSFLSRASVPHSSAFLYLNLAFALSVTLRSSSSSYWFRPSLHLLCKICQRSRPIDMLVGPYLVRGFASVSAIYLFTFVLQNMSTGGGDFDETENTIELSNC